MSFDIFVYLHWPFCLKKCRYCDFVSLPRGVRADHTRYLEALVKELEYRIKHYHLSECSLQTIYFGGGTPSLLGQHQIRCLIERLMASFSHCDDPEITLEVNPATVTSDSLEAMFESGINRLSIGIQTFQDRFLRFLGRTHTAGENRKLLEYLLRRKPSIPFSVDLMYGLPFQTLTDWQYDVDTVLAYRPVHCSIYNLTLHPRVPLAHFRRRHAGAFPGPDREAVMFEWTMDKLSEAGYLHYEISNFSLTGYQSRHNLAYWSNQETLGLGLGAWSFLFGRREKNTRHYTQYLERIDRTLDPSVYWERLEPLQHARETFLLALRTNHGGNLALLSGMPDHQKITLSHTIESLLLAGFITREGTTIFLTRKGLLVADQVFQELID